MATKPVSPRLRDLFPDTKTVLIYPDDFEAGHNGNNIVLADLVDRHSGHFSDRRVVVLFRPGVYDDINFPVGYWTQVMGLGETPEDVEFRGSLGVYCLPANTDNPDVGSLDTFWRSAENFTSNTTFLSGPQGKPSVPIVTEGSNVQKSLHPPFSELYPLAILEGDASPEKGMLWAVSQAAPLRRVRVKHNLHLSLGNNCASGGFMSNVDVGAAVSFGSQQQFCVRNCECDRKTGGAWSMVLMGCTSKSNRHGDWVGRRPHLIDEPHPFDGLTIEKPFLFLDESNVLYLGIPRAQLGTNGTNHERMSSMERVMVDNQKSARVFNPHHAFSFVQEAANEGVHIVLSPGIYNWGKTLVISKHHQVVLGLGMATIQAPGDGSPCIMVQSGVYDVRLSGLALEATVISKFIYEGSTLIQWGTQDDVGRTATKGNVTQPSAIHDLYCFVGGRRTERTVKVQCMVKIFASDVVGDNLWLWRADHCLLMPKETPNRPELSEYHVTTEGECQCETGLEVYGDRVTMYGLAAEHTTGDITSWRGQHGRVYFYQSELPYDVTRERYVEDTCGYRVHIGADHHIAKGIGVYSYFRDCPNIKVKSGVSHHAFFGSFSNVFTVWLNGFSGLKSVINGEGPVTSSPGNAYFVEQYDGESFWSRSLWLGVWKKLSSLFWKEKKH